MLGFGYETSFIGTTIELPSFKRDFGLDTLSESAFDDVSSNITSLFSVGGFFGALSTFFALDLFGRRAALLGANAIFVIGSLITLCANGRIGAMYVGRVFSGVGMGGCVAVAPTYISELSPPAIRGRMTGFFESFYHVGSLIGFWINYGITRHIDTRESKSWRIPMGVQLIPGGLVLLALPFLIESPTWLLKKQRHDEGVAAFAYIRNLAHDHVYIIEDVAFVKGQIDLERSIVVQGEYSIWNYLRGAGREAVVRGVRNRFALVAMVTMLQPWCGAVAINYYSTTIFKSIGLEDTRLWTGVYGLVKSASSILYFSLFIDLVGRKRPWIISCVSCAACMHYLGAYVKIVHPVLGGAQPASEVAAGKAATAAIMLFGFFWSFGANGLPLLIASEIFPPTLRSVSGPFSSLSVWFWSFVVTKVVPYMYTSMGYGVYFFFACVLTFAAFYGHFWIPETKGLRLDQMDLLFGSVAGHTMDYQREIQSEKREIMQEESVEHMEQARARASAVM